MTASIRPPAAEGLARHVSCKKGFALSAVSLLLGACLQTDPGAPTPDNTTVTPPVDDGRSAGATSSTNWPTDFGDPRVITISGKADADLHIHIKEFLTVPPFGNLPLKANGKISFFKAGVIPALEASLPTVVSFQEEDTIVIGKEFLDSLFPLAGDTLNFNAHIRVDTVEAFIIGFSYSKREGKFLQSPISENTGTPVFLKHPRFYYKGNLKVDPSQLPPATGSFEYCFYIPGTPVFIKTAADGHFEIGPMPFGNYPLRLMRLVHLDSQPRETLVEAWELKVDEKFFDSSVTVGAKVISVKTQGILNLRNAE